MKKKLLLPLLSLLFICFSCTNSKKEIKTEVKNTKSIVVNNTVDNENSDLEKPTISKKTISSKSSILDNKKEPILNEIDLLREKHTSFLNNSPYKKVMSLSKTERKAMGIPPNKYFESEWELTMNPETGKPETPNLISLRDRLIRERAEAFTQGRAPGDASDNNWVERGPTNVGGRTRGIMFDPNDATKETVFAGGVSGGLWKNTNISNSSSTWTRVNIQENLSVSTITYDPNNTNIFYVGTGESYVGGDVSGDGVWKSTDGGLTFSKVFGGISGPTTFQSAANVTINSPTSVAGNYVSYPSTAFGTAVTSQITENVILVNDGTGTTASLGCNGLANAGGILGKIALIRRGTCTFVVKVKNAQDAGAIGVIMMNNVEGTPVAMGGSDPTINIPSTMISKADGDAIEAALASGPVNATLNPSDALSFTGNLVPGKQHINDIKIRNNAGNSEIYVAVGDTFYGSANATTFLGGTDYGLYKSINGGATWTEVSMPLTSGGFKHCPNDIAIGADNKIWVSTTNSVVFGTGGGNIFSSTDGTNFILRHNVSGGDRTQIEASATTADKIYVLSELSAGGVIMKKTTNGFGLATNLTLPVDADGGIPATDFTRSQAFYNLMLKIDPVNDELLYTGGIDLFKSLDGGSSWEQLSHWTGSFGYQYVHSDQHVMAIANGNSNKVAFGGDGGVFFSNNAGTTTTARNTGLNVTQFYSIGVAPTNAVSGLTGSYFVAGAQDNGSQYFANAPTGAGASTQAQGGDGAFSMFDQGADKYYITNYVYNENINYRLAVSPFTVRTLDNDTATTNNGAFIAPMALDSSLDILFSDYSNTATPTYQVRRYSNIKSGVVNRANLTNALLTNSPSALTVSKYTTTSTTLLVGTRTGKLLKVINANTGTGTWSDITGPSFVGSVSDIEYGLSESEIFVTFHNYNVTSIWYTSNGGATWQNKEGNFPDIPVKSILQNPLNTNEVIIGTELGVWYTNTFNTVSPTWNQSFNGMSNVKITDMDLRNDNTVFVATYGRGIFSGQFTATILSNDTVQENKGGKVYPNPSNGIVNLNIANFTGKLNISIIDLNGKIVHSENDLEFNTEKAIDLNNLQSGVYILNATGESLNFTEKIIIK